MLNADSILNEIFTALPALKNQHNHDSAAYILLDSIRAKCIEDLFSISSEQQVTMSPFGHVQLPFYSMGAINSTHLFGLDELIIFSYYAANVGRYKRTADIGADIGLHSIIMSKLGFQVQCYEPDPRTFERLKENIYLNGVFDSVEANQKAVSTQRGTLEFTRVLGNTTGSHLSGAKENPYGELERLEVEVENFIDIMKSVDLLKIDVEGHEAEILCKTSRINWSEVDAIVEIGTDENAKRVYSHMSDIGVIMFSQKNSWKRVESIDAVPTSYKEGSLFITAKNKMFWEGFR